jgi:transposase-like protein
LRSDNLDSIGELYTEDNFRQLVVAIEATPAFFGSLGEFEGKKELVGLIDGVRESSQSWKELLLDLKRRGLAMAPELAVADGALGFWQAIEEVWPKTRGQRCWVHKTANVLNKLPKSQHSRAKRALQEIWMAETKKDALVAFDAFVETWGVKYDKAVQCLTKDRDALLAFYDFPAEHWKHLRTTNVIESSFATVRHRTVRSKGCLSNKTALAMIFRRCTNDDQQALRIVLEAGLHMDAVDPEVDIAFGREIALTPARVLVRPGFLEPRDGRG